MFEEAFKMSSFSSFQSTTNLRTGKQLSAGTRPSNQLFSVMCEIFFEELNIAAFTPYMRYLTCGQPQSPICWNHILVHSEVEQAAYDL